MVTGVDVEVPLKHTKESRVTRPPGIIFSGSIHKVA